MTGQDAQQRAAQDGQLAVPVAAEPATVAVDDGVHAAPGIDADGAVVRGAGQDEGFVRFGVRGGGVVMAGDGDAVAAGPAAFAGPGDRVAVEDAGGRQPDQQVHRLPGQRGGQGGGAVPGIEDDQRRAAAVVPGGAEPAQQVPDLPGGLVRTGGLGGAPGVDQGGPRGAQVPGRGQELVLPAGTVLRTPSQRHASWCTCSRPGEHSASGRG